MPAVFWPGLVAILCLLVCVQFVPAVHHAVSAIDQSCAFTFNALIGKNVALDKTLALLNTKYGDIFVVSCIAILVCTHALLGGTLKETARRLSFMIYLALWCLFTYLVVCSVVNELIPRPTPIAALPLNDVHKMYGIKLRSSAHHSFPSGHALAYMFFAMGSAARYIRMAVIFAVFGAVMLCLRLALGLHWLSDMLLGSLPLTLLMMAVCTQPICIKAYEFIERLVNLVLTEVTNRSGRHTHLQRETN